MRIPAITSILPAFLLAFSFPCRAQRSLHRWDFSRGTEGWSAVHSVAPLSVRDGRLQVKILGVDPFIASGPAAGLGFEGNTNQFIRIRARCTVQGAAEFFWASAGAGGGPGRFEAGKEIGFTMPGDNRLHTCNVFPAWQGKIQRVRFDPPGGADEGGLVEIESIEILELPAAARSGGPVWEFTGTLDGFIPARDIEQFRIDADGVELAGNGTAPTLALSGVSLDASVLPWLTVDLTVDAPTVLTVRWRDAQGELRPGARADTRIAPGAVHHAIQLAGCRGWHGRITGLEISWRADARPVTARFRRIALARAPLGPAAAELCAVGFDRAFVFLGENVTLESMIRNGGGAPLAGAALEIAGPDTRARVPIPDLAPGAQSPARIRLRPARLGEWPCRISVAGARDGTMATVFVAQPPPRSTAPGRGAVLAETECVLASDRVRLRAPAFEAGEFGPLLVELLRDEEWRRVAILPAIGAVRIEGVPRGEEIITARVAPLPGASAGLRFERLVPDATGARWIASAEYRLTDDPHRIDAVHTLEAAANGAVRRFDGPQLRVGDGTFGAAKREALFPGLEYLEAHEHSSSDRDIVPPGDLRIVPHPHRVCIPVQAVTSPEGDLVALLWDNRQRWFGTHDQPAALFASPNLVEGGDPRIDPPPYTARSASTHLLGLFLPSVPGFVEENAIDARNPVTLRRGDRLTLRSSIHLKPDADVLDAVVQWCRLFRPAPAGAPPLPLKEHYALCLRAFEELLHSEGRGWASVKGWAPQPNPDTALLYLHLARELDRPDLRQLAATRTTNVRALPLSLHLGGAGEAVAHARAAGVRLLDGREPDGAWVFRPSPKTVSLGARGDTNVGIGAGPIRAILSAAALTADPRLLAEGLKGLDWLRKWRVPRGAQVWEIPLHAPDILASAHACEAFLWGHRLTGEQAYLDDAVHWARTGLPFVYFWQAHAEGIEPMRGGTIPIFGATFHVGSWFGRLVQWCGLEYAEALIDLARFDRSFDWRAVAADIVVSGWRQQQRKQGYQGLYPDSWSMFTGDISWGLMLGPARLLRNQLALDGRNPEGDVRLFRRGERRVALMAPGKLDGVVAGAAAGGECAAEIGTEPFDLAFSHAFDLAPIARVALVGVDEPREAMADGTRLARRAGAGADDQPGWWVDPAMPGIVLRLVHHADRPVRVTIAGLRLSPVTTRRTCWTFTDGAGGWRAEHDLEPLRVSDGALICAPTGTDPYLSTALMDVAAAEFGILSIRCRPRGPAAGAAGALQIFWATQEGGFVPERSASTPIPAGAGWRDVSIEVGRSPAWRGVLTALRIDPPTHGLEIAEVRLVPGSPDRR